MAGDSRAPRTGVLLGRRRVHRVEGLQAAEEGAAEVPVRDDEGTAGSTPTTNKLSIAQVVDGERGGGVRQERGGDQRVHRQDHRARWSTSSSPGSSADRATLPGPIKLKTKAGDGLQARAWTTSTRAQRGVGVVAAYALAGSEENARGHLVVTAPTGGSAGVMPAIVYALGEGRTEAAAGEDPRRDAGRRPRSVTCASTTRRCRAPRAAARPRSASPRRWAPRSSPRRTTSSRQVVANAAESSLEHHLGMTCDPVAGYVQVPCIERCAFGAVKAWTGFMIASNEIPIEPSRRLRHDGERDGAHREGDEHQVQGDVRGRPGGVRGALLTRWERSGGFPTRRPGGRGSEADMWRRVIKPAGWVGSEDPTLLYIVLHEERCRLCEAGRIAHLVVIPGGDRQRRPGLPSMAGPQSTNAGRRRCAMRPISPSRTLITPLSGHLRRLCERVVHRLDSDRLSW